MGLNCGSTNGLASTVQITKAGRCAISTTLAAAGAGAGSMLFDKYFLGRIDVASASYSVLTGLVSITAGCHAVPYWAAIIIGFVAAAIFRILAVSLSHVFFVDLVGSVNTPVMHARF
jgi:ammonium transporter, Amt family